MNHREETADIDEAAPMTECTELHGWGIDDDTLLTIDFHADDPWIGWFGRPAHPKAPCGSGGPGAFRRPGPAGLTAPVVASDFGGEGDTTTAKKKNPPPTAKAGQVAVKVKQPSGVQCSITVEVLADAIDKDKNSTGTTTCWWKDYKFVPPVPVYDQSSGLAFVSSISNTPQVTAVLGIQTTYTKKYAEYLISGYGRGTTTQDIKDGNVTLGFHESCHRDDFISYLNTQNLPAFDGGVGMVSQEFLDDWSAFVSAFRNLPTTIGDWSRKRTDDVGVTKTTWDARHKKKAAPAHSKP